MTRLDDNLRLHTVIAVAREHVSTPQAYTALDEKYGDFTAVHECGTLSNVTNAAKTGKLPATPLYNIFESVVLPICPGASDIKEKMLSLGATHALMSGSGPSVFGIFESAAAAQSAQKVLIDFGYTAYYATSV